MTEEPLAHRTVTEPPPSVNDHNTLFARAVTVAKECGGRFSSTNVPPSEPLDVVHLAARHHSKAIRSLTMAAC